MILETFQVDLIQGYKCLQNFRLDLCCADIPGVGVLLNAGNLPTFSNVTFDFFGEDMFAE